MPVVPAPAKILVTGANGFAAAWIIRTLLEDGYFVRGTVRSLSKGAHLERMFEKYSDKFELAVVEDITADGAFDEAVKGVDGIEHTASPVTVTIDDPQEVIAPALKGTVGILNSVLRYGKSVKRIVITASCACIVEHTETPKWYSELNWNERCIATVNELGRKADGRSKYWASKTLAEKAAWEFVEKHKEEIGWDLLVIHPPYIFGPPIQEATTFDSLNLSIKEWYNSVVNENVTEEALKTTNCWVDVRDLAKAHVLGLQKEEAGGQRVIVTAGPYVWQEWVDTANALNPSPIPSHPNLPKGTPGGGRSVEYLRQYDTSKEKRLFGIHYKTMEETTRDMLAAFEARGW